MGNIGSSVLSVDKEDLRLKVEVHAGHTNLGLSTNWWYLKP